MWGVDKFAPNHQLPDAFVGDMSHSIVSLGEILFDCFKDHKALGGAPTNFAAHVAALGKPAAIVSAIGRDELGASAYNELYRRGINLSGVMTNDLPTGTVNVELQGGEPKYTINRPAAWDAIELDDVSHRLVSKAAAVCFGTLAQREEKSRVAIRTALERCEDYVLRLLDVNLRTPFYDDDLIRDSIALANALKMNSDEVPIIAKAMGVSSSVSEFATAMLHKFEIRYLIITAGAEGATLYRGDEFARVSAPPVNAMVSAVGAGDAFTAAAVCGYLDEQPLEQIARSAARLAAATCEHAGGMPPY
jgi:fructokinase